MDPETLKRYDVEFKRLFAEMTDNAKERSEKNRQKHRDFVKIQGLLDQEEAVLIDRLNRINHQQAELSNLGWAVLVFFPRPDRSFIANGILERNFNLTGANKNPVIYVNDITCSYDIKTFKLNSYRDIEINLRPTLIGNPEVLRVRCKPGENFPDLSDHGIEMRNPYYVKQEWLEESRCVWQCQGHADEKKILIVPPENSEWRQHQGSMPVSAEFDLLSNSRKIETVRACFLINGVLSVYIPRVNKDDCVDKCVELRLSHVPSIKIKLPPPKVMTVNHEIVSR